MSQLDDALGKAKQLISSYEAIRGTEVPKSLKDALDRKWELAAEESIAEITTVYHKGDQDADSRRLITLRKAAEVLAAFEDAVVTAAVLNPAQIFVTNFRRQQAVAEFVEKHAGILWTGVRAIIEAAWHAILHALANIAHPIDAAEALYAAIVGAIAEVLYFAATAISAAFLAGMVTALDLPVFRKSFKVVLTEQKKAIKAAHDSALFQAPGFGRQWQKKLTRR